MDDVTIMTCNVATIVWYTPAHNNMNHMFKEFYKLTRHSFFKLLVYIDVVCVSKSMSCGNFYPAM